MVILIIFSIIAWAHAGADQIRDNWHPPSPANIVRQVFNGVCIGMLGLTGFECEYSLSSLHLVQYSKPYRSGAPAYVGRMRTGQFPRVLRNLHYPAIALSTVVALLVLAVLPIDAITEENNVLGTLATKVNFTPFSMNVPDAASGGRQMAPHISLCGCCDRTMWRGAYRYVTTSHPQAA